MKNLMKLSLIIFIVGASMTSCEKDDINNVEATTEKGTFEQYNKVGDVGGPGTDCASEEVNIEASDRSIGTIDLTPAYNLESDILETTSKGLDYQSDYYTMSSYAIDNGYIVSEFTLHYNALEAGVAASNILTDGNETDEVITNSRHEALMDLIDFYEGETNPSNINAIISSLKSDLDLNKNKTKSEVLIFLED